MKRACFLFSVLASLSCAQALADNTVTVLPNGDLEIVGTSGNDVIQVSLTSTPNTLRVRLNAVIQNYAGVTGDVIMHGGDGADTLQMTNVTKNGRLYGEGGNDYISGYYGNDLLVGGDGVDRLLGSSGNDVLVAGDGVDVTDAGIGDDLVFHNRAGTTDGDDANDAAMKALAEDWAADAAVNVVTLDDALIAIDDNDPESLGAGAGYDMSYMGTGDASNAEIQF
jgi:Ca2+-binding RTX toxin-like protein